MGKLAALKREAVGVD
jgi:hypothetical protein